jgi:hypothetical protein
MGLTDDEREPDGKLICEVADLFSPELLSPFDAGSVLGSRAGFQVKPDK